MKKLLGYILLFLLTGCNKELVSFSVDDYSYNKHKQTCVRYCGVFGDSYKYDGFFMSNNEKGFEKITCRCAKKEGTVTWYKYIEVQK